MLRATSSAQAPPLDASRQKLLLEWQSPVAHDSSHCDGLARSSAAAVTASKPISECYSSGCSCCCMKGVSACEQIHRAASSQHLASNLISVDFLINIAPQVDASVWFSENKPHLRTPREAMSIRRLHCTSSSRGLFHGWHVERSTGLAAAPKGSR